MIFKRNCDNRDIGNHFRNNLVVPNEFLLTFIQLNDHLENMIFHAHFSCPNEIKHNLFYG